jgi:hypothetical protein
LLLFIRGGLMDAMATEGIRIEIGVNVETRRPSVVIFIGRMRGELTVAQARKFGQQLISAATEAEMQGFLLDWMTEHFGQFNVQQASTLAVQFKQYLAEQRRRRLRPDDEAGGDRPDRQ